jgi:hypothetical protein
MQAPLKILIPFLEPDCLPPLGTLMGAAEKASPNKPFSRFKLCSILRIMPGAFEKADGGELVF